MTRNAKVDVRHLVRSTTATVALVAGGCLLISGTTAETAAGEGANDSTKNETWIEKTYVVGPEASAKDDAQKHADVEPGKDGKSTAASKNSKKPNEKGKSTPNAFRPGPKYEKKYDANEQLDIYGGKSAVEPPRPLLEIGRQQYTSGILDESSTLLGKLNPLLPGLAVYGDWRTAVAYNKNNGKDIVQVATRLIDYCGLSPRATGRNRGVRKRVRRWPGSWPNGGSWASGAP